MSSLGMKEKYQSLALADLKEIAKSRGIKGTSSMKKADVIEAMLALDEKEGQGTETVSAEQKPAAHHKKTADRRTGAPQAAEGEKADAAQSQGRPQENRSAEGQGRPQENGTLQSGGMIVKNDVSKLTREDRAEIARRAMRGEKIQF